MSFGTSPIELLATDSMIRGGIFCNQYDYPAKWITGLTSALGSLASVDQAIQITSEADFVCQELNLIAWSAAATLSADPNIEINIQIASGRPWFNTSMNARLICGTYSGGNFPNKMVMPRLIPAKSTVTVTLTDQQSVAWNRVEVALIGFNVYYQTETREQVFHVI
jgi:hypothetical protein